MIFSIDIAAIGLRRGLRLLASPPRPQEVAGLRYAETVFTAPLGRLMPWRIRPFLRASGPAEADVLKEPGLLKSTGFGRLPNLVSTFSLWRSASTMRDYAYRQGGSHRAAVAGDRERAFHRHSAFIRFRPYASRGEWDGRDPLALAAVTA